MKSILFVCVENSSRSQMAEAFAKMYGEGKVAAFSAGSRAGGKVSAKAIEAMMEKGYDLSKHKSKSVDEFSNEHFDFVITMGCGDQCPYIRAKHHLDWQIPDPSKMDREEFRKVCDLIELKVKELLSKEIIMSHLDEELNRLKTEIISMWNLVIHQLQQTQTALITLDKDLARDVIANEKHVNEMELKIDRDCENIFALFNPVAVDLRFVLAVLKINNNIERTGDIAEGIAKFILSVNSPFDEKLLESTQVLFMFEEATDMLQDTLKAFVTEDTQLARSIFKRDDALDDINKGSNDVAIDYIRNNPNNIDQALYITSTIRKLERVGDQSKNIAEELIFYVEAKVLKHAEKKQKQE